MNCAVTFPKGWDGIVWVYRWRTVNEVMTLQDAECGNLPGVKCPDLAFRTRVCK